ncbi:hypothetical protein RRG08_066972 [Elysia crispata]|uniref:Uncharacterized protein n=1 Tax=Elysia crispata TaxID=231223 RepID=A0AAE0Z9M1_9GAST|nr:hypothetical protein RRG08_066972 [Elysia crispata]
MAIANPNSFGEEPSKFQLGAREEDRCGGTDQLASRIHDHRTSLTQHGSVFSRWIREQQHFLPSTSEELLHTSLSSENLTTDRLAKAYLDLYPLSPRPTNSPVYWKQSLEQHKSIMYRCVKTSTDISDQMKTETISTFNVLTAASGSCLLGWGTVRRMFSWGKQISDDQQFFGLSGRLQDETIGENSMLTEVTVMAADTWEVMTSAT